MTARQTSQNQKLPASTIPQWPSLFSFPAYQQMSQMMMQPWATLWNLPVPSFDMEEDDKHLKISATIPGLEAVLEDAELSLDDGVLTIDIPKKIAAKKQKD
jgi:HSP20 family molecular chaperone IbpA